MVGLGLRAPHFRDVLQQRPGIDFFEVHSENFFGGGALVQTLEQVRRDYPVALHGVAMGLLSSDELDARHLDELARLVDRIDPVIVSEHLCWTRLDGVHFHELLPAPATEALLAFAVDRVQQVQERLQRPLVLENITRYVEFRASTMPEGEFLRELARRSGCRLLVDLQNLHLNEINLGASALDVLRALPAEAVAELHLAGHEVDDEGLAIDTHGAAVPPPVWELLRVARVLFGPVPTIVERDQHLPPFQDLLDECAHARQILVETNDQP